MSISKYLCFFFLISLIQSQENITYIMQMGKSPEPTVYSEQKRVNLNIDISAIKNKNANNLIFYLYPNNNYNYIKAYLSLSKQNPTFDDCDYKILSDSKPTFYLSKKEFENINYFYISVECKDNCYFYYSGHGMTEYNLIERTRFTKFFNLNEVLKTKFNFENNKESILFTAISSDSDEICFKVKLNNDTKIKPTKILPNSYGLILQSNLKDNFTSAEFEFQNCLENKLNYALISTVTIFNDNFYEKVDLFENVITAINSSKVNRKLFKFTSKKEGKYSIRIETISLNLIVEVINHERKDNQYQIKKMIKQIGFINLDLEENKEYDINFYVENPPKDIIGIRFQIIYYEELIDFQFKNMEIFRNIPTRDFLSSGKINYYRVISRGDNFTTLEYHLHILSGYPILYYIKCTDFPNCKYNYNDIQEEIKKGNAITNQDINDNIFIYVTPEDGDFYLNKTQYLAVVYCDENKKGKKDCEYQIEIHNTKGKGGNLLLLDNVITYDSIKKSDSEYDYYKFEVNELKINYVHIVSYCYSGYINLNPKFLGKGFEESNRINYGNIEEYVFKRDNNNTIDGYFNLQIIGKESSFYSILYYTDQDYSNIKSGEEIIKVLKLGETKLLRFTNRNLDDKSLYIININAINCELKAKLNEREQIEIKNHQFIIKNEDPDYDKSFYEVNIIASKLDDIDNKQYDYCIFQISGNENHEERELTLNEGYNHITNFNKDISSFTYIYPYYLNQVDGDEELFFSIIKNDNSKYKIISKINQGENVENEFILNEQKLIFLKDDLKKNCKNILICPIKLTIKLTSEIKEDENYKLSFKFLSTHNIPKYLNSIYEIDGVKTDSDNKLLNSKYSYFYKDVKKLEKDQIEIYYIDFIRGHGNVVVKLIPKNIIEENANWNRRIVLPVNDTNNGSLYVEYNIQNHFFKLDDKITEKCSDFNCEVYIGVYSLDSYDDDKKNFEDAENYKLNEFTIRSIKYTNIKENELLFFYLNENKKDVNLNFNIEKNSDVIFINFNSDSCYLNIETEVDSKKVSWEINSSNELFLINANDEKIKKDNLKGLNFKLIGNLEKNAQECRFSIRYYIHEKDYPEIFVANSNIETIGKFNNYNLCYFVIPILLVQKVKNVAIYLNDINKINSDDLEIHANILELNEYLKLDTPEKIIKKFPTSNDGEHDYTTKDNFDKNYLYINRIGDKNLDYIILITVENISEKKSNSLVNLLTIFDKVKNSVKVNNDKFELVKIYNKKKVNLNLSGRNNTFYIELGLANGEVQLENLQRQIEKFNLTKGRIYGLYYKPISGEQYQLENFMHLGSSLLFIRLTQNDFKNNINKISYNNRNVIRFNSKYSQIKFPISFYTNIDKDFVSYDNDIQISIKLIKENKINKTNDNFNLIGGLVDNDFINKVKYTNEKIEPEITSENEFNDGLREARFIFRNQIIKDNINKNVNFFVLINNDDQMYNDFIVEVNILKIGLINEKLVIPDNNYYFSNITSNIQIYKLKKNTDNDEKMLIEFSSSFSDNYYITINKENSQNFTQNYTDFIQSDVFKYGKSYIEINLKRSTDIKYILFAIIKNETYSENRNIRKKRNDNSTINNFILKYKTNKFYNFSLPDENIIFLNDSLTFSVKRIMREKTLVEDAVYYMNIYSKDEIKDKNQLKKLAPLIKPKYKFIPTNYTEVDILFKIDESILKDGKFYICILVTAYYDNTQEILQYEIYDYEYNKPPSDNPKSKWWIWVIIILIIIFVGFIIYIYLFKNKLTNNGSNNNYYDLNKVSGGLLDEKEN